MGLLWFQKHFLKTNDRNSESSNESGKYCQISAQHHLAFEFLLFVSSIQRIHSWWFQWFNHGIAVQLINCSTRSLYQCFLLKFLLMLVENVNRVQYGKNTIRNILMDMMVKYELVKWSGRWTENWWNNQACGGRISDKRSSWKLFTNTVAEVDIGANAV